MHTNIKYFLILGAISVLFFFFSAYVVDNSLKTRETTAIEIISPKGSLYDYNSSKLSPFKYRLLFSSIVIFTYDALKGNVDDNDLFYYTYVSVTGITYILAALAFFYLLISIGFNAKLSLFGSFIFLASPSVVFAFTLPVHSREDLLAYSILCLGLVSIIKNKTSYVFLFCILGVLCRETLLILPFLYLFFQPKAKIVYRFGFAMLSFSVFLMIRIYTGYESYNVLNLGLLYNLNNLAESIGFIFLCFSFMWIFLAVDLYKSYFIHEMSTNKEIEFFRKSAFWVFLLVFSSTLVGGRFNEIRLMNLMFPWMIIIFLYYFQKYYTSIKILIRDRFFKAFSVGLLAILIPILIIILGRISTFFPKGQFDIPYGNWVIITFIYFYIFSLTFFLVSKYVLSEESYAKSYMRKIPND